MSLKSNKCAEKQSRNHPSCFDICCSSVSVRMRIDFNCIKSLLTCRHSTNNIKINRTMNDYVIIMNNENVENCYHFHKCTKNRNKNVNKRNTHGWWCWWLTKNYCWDYLFTWIIHLNPVNGETLGNVNIWRIYPHIIYYYYSSTDLVWN